MCHLAVPQLTGGEDGSGKEGGKKMGKILENIKNKRTAHKWKNIMCVGLCWVVCVWVSVEDTFKRNCFLPHTHSSKRAESSNTTRN